METQSGARTPLVDPFGAALEEWLRDAPATRTPYESYLVVPPVTGPVQRPGATTDATADDTTTTVAPVTTDLTTTDLTTTDDEPAPAVAAAPAALPEPAAPAFRRDRARHAAVCAPSFPEPPERLALRVEDLAIELSASTGRSTIDRIVRLEDEVRLRDEDLARLAAWEATVAGTDDPEVVAARAFARTVFADLLADAAAEADRRDRVSSRRDADLRAATAPIATVAAARTAAPAAPAAARTAVPAAAPAAAVVVTPAEAVALVVPERDEPVRPVLGLPAVSPVSANTRPTPLIQPATGPTVIDRAAFAAALTAHQGTTASTPVVLPEQVSLPVAETTAVDAPAAPQTHAHAHLAEPAAPGWWSRLVAGLLRALGRR